MKIVVLEEWTNSILNILIVKRKGVLFRKSLKPQETHFNQPGFQTDDCYKLLSQASHEGTHLGEAVHINTNERYLNTKSNNSTLNVTIMNIDEFCFSVFVKELTYSSLYRERFLNNFRNVSKLKSMPGNNELIICLENKMPPPIDYNWESRCSYLVLERMQLESVMSWLSTLGGAFSALGDFDLKFAEKAGVTSYKQMIIACRLGDANLISRCWLYCALSLTQKKKFKQAAAVIKHVHQWAKSQPDGKVDFRLFNMCQGIWTKLKYDRNLYLSNKIRTKCSSRRL